MNLKSRLNIKTRIAMEIFKEFFRLYGQAELSGPQSNKAILGIINKVLPAVKDDSEAAWCGIFMGHLFDSIMLGHLKPAKFASAKAWAGIGEEITIDEARPGNTLVVFHRGNPGDWRGHVGLYVNHNDTNVFVAGGNQSNSVTISPYSRSRLFRVIKFT